MPSEGDEVLMVLEDTAFSGGPVTVGDKVVLYTEELARGPTLEEQGIDVLLLHDGLAQGNTAAIELGTLTGDKALYKGDTLLLEIPVTNNGTAETDYTVEFKENGSAIGSKTQTIGSDGEAIYSQKVTKSNPGCFRYQANNSNELKVCWMNVRPGDLQAFPRTVWLGASDTSSELSITVENPSAESKAWDIQVEFLENGSAFTNETHTIDPGSDYTFTTSVSKSSEQVNDYRARITVTESNITVDSNAVQVKWTNNKAAAVDLGPLKADDKMLYVGETTNFTIDAVNTTSADVSYQLNFLEGPTKFDSETNTVASRSTATYTSSRSNSQAGTYTYRAEDPDGINRSNLLDVTWMNVRPGQLTADELSHYLSESDTTSHLSITVDNPSTQDREVTVDIEENGAVIDTETATIAAGGSHTFGTGVSKSAAGSFVYKARVTETATGISGESNAVTIEWLEEETEFASIPISAFVEDYQTGTNFYSATLTAGGGGVERLRVEATETRQQARVEYEDEQDFDYNDCDIIYDYREWDEGGYCKITIEHQITSNGHCWRVGQNAGSGGGYDVGCHDADPNYRQIFFGVFWQDGVVTDGAGNTLGTWK